MTDILVRVSLSATSDFHPLALAPGLPMLDPKKLTYQVLLGWFGDLLAEPFLDETGVTFRLPSVLDGVEGIQRTVATDTDLDGPLASDFETLKKSLFDIRPVSPAERLIFNRLSPPIANHEGMLYRIRSNEGLDRLVWCWGFQRRVAGGRTQVCPNRECCELFLHQEETPEVCPRCGQSFALALPSSKRRTSRKPIGAIVATAALTALGLGTYWYAATATDEGDGHDSPLALLEPRNLQSAEKPAPVAPQTVKQPVEPEPNKIEAEAKVELPDPVLNETPDFPSTKVLIAESSEEPLLPDFTPPSIAPPKFADPDLPDLSSVKTDPGADVPKLDLPTPDKVETTPKSPDSVSTSPTQSTVTPPDLISPNERTTDNPPVRDPARTLRLPDPDRLKPIDKPLVSPKVDPPIGPLFPDFPKTKGTVSEPKLIEPELPERSTNSLQKDAPVRLSPTLEPSLRNDGVPVIPELPQRERRTPRLKWHGDYLAAYQHAIEQQRQVVMVLHEPFQDVDSSSVLGSFATPETEQILETFVRVQVSTGATVPGISPAEAPTRLLEHRSFRHLNGRAGIVVIDLTDSKSPHFGRVVTALPIPENGKYSPELVNRVLRLPSGSIGLRSVVLAIRTSLPDGNCASDAPNELLTQLASRSTRLMAKQEQVGSFEQPDRITSVVDRFGADVRMREIVFATLAPTSIQNAGVEAVRQWLQNSDDLAALTQSSLAYGVDLYQSPSSQRWYASCIIVNRSR